MRNVYISIIERLTCQASGQGTQNAKSGVPELKLSVNGPQQPSANSMLAHTLRPHTPRFPPDTPYPTDAIDIYTMYLSSNQHFQMPLIPSSGLWFLIKFVF